ncbi:MAG: hypothetical protein WA705_29935 [Candidatus Ozemobacteraceae bacterium]
MDAGENSVLASEAGSSQTVMEPDSPLSKTTMGNGAVFAESVIDMLSNTKMSASEVFARIVIFGRGIIASLGAMKQRVPVCVIIGEE